MKNRESTPNNTYYRRSFYFTLDNKRSIVNRNQFLEVLVIFNINHENFNRLHLEGTKHQYINLSGPPSVWSSLQN